MSSPKASMLVRITAAIASAAATLALFGAVASLSEPQRSQLIAATAGRQATTIRTDVRVAQAQTGATGSCRRDHRPVMDQWGAAAGSDLGVVSRKNC